MIYADVIIDISVEKLDKSFQYRVPGELQDRVYPGAVCLIPFGKGGRTIRGYVISLSETPVIDESRIRDISDVVSVSGKPGGEEQLLKLAFWIKKQTITIFQRNHDSCNLIVIFGKFTRQHFTELSWNSQASFAVNR